MDSLKVSTLTTSSGLMYWLDVIPAILMCVMFVMNIVYLYWKIVKIKES
jgi:hypothetical protein